MRRILWRIVCGLTVALVLAMPTAAQVPNSVHYQGLVLDENGAPMNGTIEVGVAIFAAPSTGTELYAETHAGVAVVDGVFAIQLGTGTNPSEPFGPALFAAHRWLAITIDGEALQPRTQFVSAAYALRAQIAEQLALN